MSDKKETEIIMEEDVGGSDDKIKKLKDKLEHCQKEKHEYLTGWQREKADFINYRRRQEEQMGEWATMLGEGIIKEILPVLDTLNASLKHDGQDNNGLKATQDQLLKILQKHGLEEIASLGEKFDHDRHEALEQIDGEESGSIVEEIQKGYLLNGKVLRTAKVKVIK